MIRKICAAAPSSAIRPTLAFHAAASAHEPCLSAAPSAGRHDRGMMMTIRPLSAFTQALALAFHGRPEILYGIVEYFPRKMHGRKRPARCHYAFGLGHFRLATATSAEYPPDRARRRLILAAAAHGRADTILLDDGLRALGRAASTFSSRAPEKAAAFRVRRLAATGHTAAAARRPATPAIFVAADFGQASRHGLGRRAPQMSTFHATARHFSRFISRQADMILFLYGAIFSSTH